MRHETRERLEAQAAEQERLADRAVKDALDSEDAKRCYDASNYYVAAFKHRRKAKRLRAVIQEFTVL